MGKKSKKKKAANTAAAEPEDDHPVTWRNPDGSGGFFHRGEFTHIGGRTVHLGHAAMPLGASPYSLDPLQSGAGMADGMGERQLSNARAMSDAFHRKFGGEENGVDPMTEAALSLERSVGLKYAGAGGSGRLRVDGKTINESMVMSTHRWIVTVLPSDIARQVCNAAIMYRDAVRAYEPMVKIRLPSASRVFGEMDLVTEANRPEAITLMNTLLAEPFGVNVYVYSKPDREIHLAIDEFVRSPRGLVNLPLDASASDILDYVHKKAGIMDTVCCFWCEKNKLVAEKLFLCNRCLRVSYCSRDCQARDWKAFHKEECPRLSGADGARRESMDDLRLKFSRGATLRQNGIAVPRYPMQIADIDDEGSVFRGDALAGYITQWDAQSGTITEKTKFFPYGLHIMPRECYQQRR